MGDATLIHWNVNPVLLELSGLEIRWYSIFFAAAFLIGYWIMNKIFKREGHDADSVDSLVIYAIMGTVIGARLVHCLFYDPMYYFSHPLSIFKIWEGGLASHGAALGILAALFIYCRNPKHPSYAWLLDRVTIPIALGGALIRIGNFFNSEIVGTPTSSRWGIVIDNFDPVPRHAVQLYEAFAYGITFVVLLLIYNEEELRSKRGLMLGVFFVLVFFARFLLEFVKTHQAGYEVGFALTVGQMLSVPFIILGLILAIRAQRSGMPAAEPVE